MWYKQCINILLLKLTFKFLDNIKEKLLFYNEETTDTNTIIIKSLFSYLKFQYFVA